jgi:hypothetical protein
MEEESRVMSFILKAQDIIALPEGKDKIESHQYMVKNQEDAIRVFSYGRFDITADVEYWTRSDNKKVPSKYMQIPSPVPDFTDTAFLIVESNIINAGMAVEYIVQNYIGVKSFIYFAIVIPGMKGNYGVEWGIEDFELSKRGGEIEP